VDEIIEKIKAITVPLYTPDTHYRPIEDKWNLLGAAISELCILVASGLETKDDVSMDALYPIGIEISFSDDTDPNELFPNTSWVLMPEGYVVYTGSLNPASSFYVGKTINPQGNLRSVPLLEHAHGNRKHGHLAPTFSGEAQANANSGYPGTGTGTGTRFASEVAIPGNRRVVNGTEVWVNQDMPGYDFLPRTPTSSQVDIGTLAPVKSPPQLWNTKTTPKELWLGNIDSDAKGTSPVQGDSGGSLSKYPYLTGAELDTHSSGIKNPTIDVSQMGVARLFWRRVA